MIYCSNKSEVRWNWTTRLTHRPWTSVPSACIDLVTGRWAFLHVPSGPPPHDARLNPHQRQSACLPGRLALWRPIFTATSGRKGSDYCQSIYNASISSKAGRDRDSEADTERERQFSAAVSPLLLNLQTHGKTCKQAHAWRLTGLFWHGMWIQRAVWCFSFNLPLSLDQIHQPATKDDVTIPQLSLPLSAALHCVCICESVCEKLHRGQIGLSLSPSLEFCLLTNLWGF